MTLFKSFFACSIISPIISLQVCSFEIRPAIQLLALGNTLAPVHYDQIDHITFLRNFLDDPQRFVYHLLND